MEFHTLQPFERSKCLDVYLCKPTKIEEKNRILQSNDYSFLVRIIDFLATVKAVPHECVNKTGLL